MIKICGFKDDVSGNTSSGFAAPNSWLEKALEKVDANGGNDWIASSSSGVSARRRKWGAGEGGGSGVDGVGGVGGSEEDEDEGGEGDGRGRK